MKKILILLLVFSHKLNAQTVTTNFQNTTICFGEQVTVPFTQTGFDTGTTFKVQLLDIDGGTVLYDNLETGTASPLVFDATDVQIGAYSVKVTAVSALTVSSVASSGLLFIGPYAKMANASGTNTDVTVGADSVSLKVNLYGAAPWVFTYTDGTFQHSVKTSTNPYFFKVKPAQNSRFSLVKVSNACGTNSSLDSHITLLINTATSLTLPSPTILTVCGGGSVKIPLNYDGNWTENVTLRVFLTDTNGLYIPNSEQVMNYKTDTLNFLLPNELVVNKDYKIRVVVTKPYLLINYINSTYKLTATGNNCTPEATLLAAEPSCGGTVLQAYPRDNANTYQYQWFKNNVLQPEQTKNYFFAADSAQYHVKITKAGYNSVSDSILVWQKAMDVRLESPNPFLCNPGDVVTVNAFPNTAGYNYYWFADSTTNGQTSKALLSNIITASFQTTQPKFYEVTIQKDGCERTVKLPISDKAASSGFVYVDGGTENRGYVILSGYDKIESIQSNVNPAEAYYFANRSITLLPGFIADKSTIFKAEIRGCSVGDTLKFENNVVYAKNDINSQFVSATGNQITFNQNTETSQVNVGDVLYSMPTANMPDGYSYKVLSKTNGSGQVTFTTEKAQLGDVFGYVREEQNFQTNLLQNPLTVFDPFGQVSSSNSTSSSNARAMAGLSIIPAGSPRFKKFSVTTSAADIELVAFDFDDDLVNTKDDQVILKFELAYGGSSNYFTWDKQNLLFALSGFHKYVATATLEYEIGASVQDTDNFKESLKEQLFNKRIKFLEIPVVPLSATNILIKPTLDFYVNFEMGVSGKLKVYVTAENFGYNYSVTNIVNNDGTIPNGKITSTFNPLKGVTYDSGVEAQAEANFKIGLGMGFTASMPTFEYADGKASYVGAYADINANLEAKAEAKVSFATGDIECTKLVIRPFIDWNVGLEGKLGLINKTFAAFKVGLLSGELASMDEKYFDFCNPLDPESDPLVAYYPFNGNTDDESQFDNHLTVTGATMTTDRNGGANKAAYFNGTNAFMTVANPKTPKTAKDRTISLWFKTDGTAFNGGSGQSLGTLLDYGTFETQKRLSMQLGGTSASIGKGKILISNLQNDVYPQTDYGNGKWHFAALVYQSNRLVLYIDGKIVKSSTQSLNTTGNELTIGRTITNTLGLTQYFKGSIDDIKIYNKALNSIEIEEIYEEEAPPTPDLTSGLVAHYKFEDNFLDETANNNDGTESGGVAFENGRNGAGKAAKFDGVDSYITTPNSQSLQNINSITISSWVNYSGLADDGTIPIIDKSIGPSIGQYYLRVRNDVSKAVEGTLNSEYSSLPFSGIQTSIWYHVLMVSTNNSFTYYLNGVKIGTVTGNHTSFSGTMPLIIGANPSGLLEVLNGSLDDIRIYNRALTDEEVLQLYNKEKPTETIDLASDLVAYYPFNGNADDESGNGNNGTVNGAILTTDRFGNIGKAYSFDGVDDRISGNWSGNLSSFTVSLWHNTNTLNQTWPCFVNIYQNSNSSNGFHINSNQSDNRYYFALHGQNVTLFGNTTIFDSWENVTVSYVNGNAKIFRNGLLLNSVSNLSQNNLSNLNQFVFGQELSGAQYATYFNGKLDDLRIYNRALSDSEVTALYNQEKP